MRHTSRLTTALAIAGGLLAVSFPASAQTASRPATNPNNKVYEQSGFRLEYPKKNWTPSGVGAGSSIVVFSEKSGEATIAIERGKGDNVLPQDQITDRTAQLEIEDWQARRQLASDFKHQIVQIGQSRIIVIDFTQAGTQGTERVRMYTLVRGADWYRVVCTTTRDSFDKYKDACQGIALSFTPTSR